MADWQLWRTKRVDDALALEPPHVRIAVADAIDRLLQDPHNPHGLNPRPTRGRTAARLPGSYIVELPHGFWLTYTPIERMAPVGGMMVRVDAFLRDAGRP